MFKIVMMVAIAALVGADQVPAYQGAGGRGAGGALDPVDALGEVVPGNPGEDYPIFSEVPETSFVCDGQVEGGYYADVEGECQPFHICTADGEGGLTKYSFLCPNGTLFNQQYFICDWWFNVDCSLAEDLYSLNEEYAAEREANSPAGGAEGRGQEQYGAPGGGRGGNGRGQGNYNGGRGGSGSRASASSAINSYTSSSGGRAAAPDYSSPAAAAYDFPAGDEYDSPAGAVAGVFDVRGGASEYEAPDASADSGYTGPNVPIYSGARAGRSRAGRSRSGRSRAGKSRTGRRQRNKRNHEELDLDVIEELPVENEEELSLSFSEST